MTAELAKKYLLIFAGSLSLVIGTIGVFLPVIPTTPFLLLSSFCYIRSSKGLYNWLIYHKVFGAYIYNYLTYRAVRKNTKICAFLFLWFGLVISVLVVSNVYITILLIGVGIGVSIHLFTLQTLDEKEFRESSPIPENNKDTF